jgi:hypothetical protein
MTNFVSWRNFTMRKAAAVIGAVCVIVLVAVVFGKSDSVTGRVVDLSCYSRDPANTGNEHKGFGMICAQACASEGFPVGLVAADGKVYRITGSLAASNNAKLVPHMAHMVTITGDVTEKDGLMMISGSDLKMSNP